MRINPEYKVREIAGENVVILQGEYGADMTRIITLNESALLLWNELLGREFAVEDAADVLIKSYDVEETTALRDAQLWIDKLSENNLRGWSKSRISKVALAVLRLGVYELKFIEKPAPVGVVITRLMCIQLSLTFTNAHLRPAHTMTTLTLTSVRLPR